MTVGEIDFLLIHLCRYFLDASLYTRSNVLSDAKYWEKAFPGRKGEEVTYDSQAFKRIMELWNDKAAGRRLIIKNPRNVVRAGEIRKAFPSARFLWIIRNPWSVIQSMVAGKREGAMILHSREVLELPPDRVLQSSASWVFGVKAMKNWPDLTVRYEDIVEAPREQLAWLGEELPLSGIIENGASDIPRNREQDFTPVRYMLRRSPYRREILDMISPIAADMGYHQRPPGFPGDTYWLGAKYFRECIKQEKHKPPYGFPHLEMLRIAIRKIIPAAVRSESFRIHKSEEI